MGLAATLRLEAKEFPPFADIAKDYQQVISTADGKPSLYTLYRKTEENQLLAELPRNFEGQRIFVATSIAGGGTFTGYQWGDFYCYWKRINDNLVLMQPELMYQARGDESVKASVKRTYTDTAILSVPIVTMGPGGGPVIDLDALLIGEAGRFALPLDRALTVIDKVKAFPENLEVAFRGPGGDGRMTGIHYSISMIPQTDYKPREADERIGYFLTVFKDFTKDSSDGKQFVRYINRWNLQKRDPQLAMSPPVQPIVFYVEHTVPVKYRRYVRDGILEWNKAYNAIGIDGAIEVRQQDARSGDFMDLDPEDVRFNFFRWITSETAFAMGPSRVNPETGQILDADIIFDDSMARYYVLDYNELIADLPSASASPESLQWLKDHPRWDPKSYLTPPAIQDNVARALGLTGRSGAVTPTGVPFMPQLSVASQVVQQSRSCEYAVGIADQMNLARLAINMEIAARAAEGGKAGEEKPDLLDGVPEQFIGQIIKEIVMHEVGHTLGLRHNFKASTWKDLGEMNSTMGSPMVGSVMDYNPINIAPKGTTQGDWITTALGPYDMWAIEYGYTADDAKLGDIAKRSAEPGLQFATDEDAMGCDPLVRRFDAGSDPLKYTQQTIDLVKRLRGELLNRVVKDGQAWYPARQFYMQLLSQQAGAVNTAARFVGGTSVNRDRKGDPNSRPPLVPTDPAQQRAAMKFVVDNAFVDSAFGLDPELLQHLATDKFVHFGNSDGVGQPEVPIHNQIMQVQRGALFAILNPTTLRRVFDNEVMTPSDADAVTLPEVVSTITKAVWTEVLDGAGGGSFTNRKPMISTLRANLQREYVADLIDLHESASATMPRPMKALSAEWMTTLRDKIDGVLKNEGKLDDYTRTHLKECRGRLDAALKAVDEYTGD